MQKIPFWSWKSPSADLFESLEILFIDRLSCYRISWCSRVAHCCYVFIRGKHPVCGEPLFCFSANPDSLSKLCGFHIDHRSRSFLLQVSGISSRLSFCCTSLVSGFIIHIFGRFVYSQSVQWYKYKIVQNLKITVKIADKTCKMTFSARCDQPWTPLAKNLCCSCWRSGRSHAGCSGGMREADHPRDAAGGACFFGLW